MFPFILHIYFLQVKPKETVFLYLQEQHVFNM